MSCKKQKTPGRGLLAADKSKAVNFAVNLYDSPKIAPCQTFKLSVDSLTRIAFLAGDLGCFYLRKCQDFINLPDPAFNEPFSKAVELLAIEDILLRRAAEMELLEAGQ
jgi:hypothetical protein